MQFSPRMTDQDGEVMASVITHTAHELSRSSESDIYNLLAMYL